MELSNGSEVHIPGRENPQRLNGNYEKYANLKQGKALTQGEIKDIKKFLAESEPSLEMQFKKAIEKDLKIKVAMAKFPQFRLWSFLFAGSAISFYKGWSNSEFNKNIATKISENMKEADRLKSDWTRDLKTATNEIAINPQPADINEPRKTAWRESNSYGRFSYDYSYDKLNNGAENLISRMRSKYSSSFGVYEEWAIRKAIYNGAYNQFRVDQINLNSRWGDIYYLWNGSYDHFISAGAQSDRTIDFRSESRGREVLEKFKAKISQLESSAIADFADRSTVPGNEMKVMTPALEEVLRNYYYNEHLPVRDYEEYVTSNENKYKNSSGVNPNRKPEPAKASLNTFIGEGSNIANPKYSYLGTNISEALLKLGSELEQLKISIKNAKGYYAAGGVMLALGALDFYMLRNKEFPGAVGFENLQNESDYYQILNQHQIRIEEKNEIIKKFTEYSDAFSREFTRPQLRDEKGEFISYCDSLNLGNLCEEII